jgi:hypothetical protein
MIVEKTNHKTEIVIDLTGPEGNAFYLIGTAKRLAKQLGMNDQQIIFEMTSGDYDSLIETFDKYFGNFVTLLK